MWHFVNNICGISSATFVISIYLPWTLPTIAITDLGEIATRELASKHKPYGLKENKKIAKMGGHAAKVAKEDIEKI